MTSKNDMALSALSVAYNNEIVGEFKSLVANLTGHGMTEQAAEETFVRGYAAIRKAYDIARKRIDAQDA